MSKPEKLHSVVTKIPSTLHRALRIKAAKEDRKLAQVFREALEKYLLGAGEGE